ncbi:MAG: SGNH/GDSL hydrolase family protein [Symploca sp. SIO3C6]|nr:SGNH/GDSL hydrolase family protein [Symploca sp. SIO3C6]
MKKQIVASGLFLFSFLLPLKATASTFSFSGMYVFGDSISDQGNIFNVTLEATGSGFPPPPYFEGRFSNSSNWIDYLAQDLGLNPIASTNLTPGVTPTQGVNFAFGGATTGIDNTGAPELPGLQQQIALFESILPPNQLADPNALYIVWAGANDYLPTDSTTFTPFETTDQTINNLSNALDSLVEIGAKNIMFVNLPDLGEIPRTFNTPLAENLNDLTTVHNQQLENLGQGLGADINFISLDINSLFNEALQGQLGFTNVTEICLNNLECAANPEVQQQFFFWDDLHPTTRAHRLVGDLALNALEPQPPASVPEPTSVLSLLAFGASGVAFVLKRRKLMRV